MTDTHDIIELARLKDVALTIDREEGSGWDLTDERLWILASSQDRKWHIALRQHDGRPYLRPYLLIDNQADETRAQVWARAKIADAVTELDDRD